jgi:NAD(P)-dependent dehydrogenase (short-subunit alcohol dehydrogenase family)
VAADVRSLPDLDRLAERARDALGGRLDILFANAGIGSFGPIENVDELFYDDQFGTNVKGLFFTVQKLLPLMGEAGSIVLNASACEQQGCSGRARLLRNQGGGAQSWPARLLPNWRLAASG